MASSTFSLKTECIRAGFRSNAKLAEEVLDRWEKLAPKAKKPQVRSLAAKLSELEVNPVWWRNHAKASQALAAALGLPIEALPLATAAVTPRRHGFEDFRDLPELDLMTEEPCRLMEEPWWSADLLRGHVWVDAPRGAGKTLVAAMHRARGQRVIQVSRLSDAIPQLPADDTPSVVHVEGPDPETDGPATDQLRSRDRVLVLANFPPPVGPRQQANMVDMLKSHPEWGPPERLGELVKTLAWTVINWSPSLGWREKLCRWIFDRLHASDRQLAGVLKWLEEHDREERLFGTPGDVLAIVGRAWESSITRLRPDGLIRWWIERRLTGTASGGGVRKDWLTALGEKALRALANAAFDDATVSFPARGSAAWWSEKLPEEIAPAAPVVALGARVQEIAQEPRPVQRTVLARAWTREAMRVSTLEAIGHLRAVNVFQPGGAGGVELAPPWVVEWWAEARAKELMLRGEPCVWGRLAAEPSRRRIVEKTLDALDRSQLLALIERALGACAEAAPARLGVVAAVEALFGAVGRRWLRSPAEAEWPLKLMHALLARQRAWLMPRYQEHIPQPLTRASSEQKGDAAWIAECWAWSFTIPRPAGFPDASVAWLFPGWNPVTLAIQPQWLRSIHPERSPSFDFMSRLAGKVLQKVKDETMPDQLTEPLLIEAMVHARAKAWVFGDDHVDAIMEREPLAHMFVKRISALDFEHRRSLLGDFWRILSARPNWSVPQLRKERPEILELLVDGLELADVETAAERGCIKFRSMRDRPLWPSAWWNAAMRILVVRHREHLHQLRDVYLDADAAEIVEAMSDADQDDDHWMRSLWRVAPVRAHERAVAAYPDAPQAARWFFSAPRDAHASLLDIVHAPVGAWTRRWLLQILPDAGMNAERVFQLLTSEERAVVGT